MKSSYLSLALFIGVFCILPLTAQVGIGTTNPQETLHVAGSNSTIRVDGLSTTNHPANNGTDLADVKVNNNGNFVVAPTPNNANILYTNSDYITTPINIATGSLGEHNSSQLFKTPAFTLTQDAIVIIDYSCSYDVGDYDHTGPIEDGKAKIIGTYFFLGDGISPSVSDFYGNTAQVYTNLSEAGDTSATGFFYTNGSKIMFLSAGTYSVHVYGDVYATDGLDNPKTSDSFSVDFGGDGFDELTILAIY